MFDRDGEFWPQLAVYLYAVGAALSVLYGIGQLLTTSSLDLGWAGVGYLFRMGRTRPQRM